MLGSKTRLKGFIKIMDGHILFQDFVKEKEVGNGPEFVQIIQVQ